MLSCGLDFGTSNSTLGIVRNNIAELLELENKSSIMRSAILFDAETKNIFYGQDGIDRYFSNTKGRLMLSIKSILGSSLLGDKTAAAGRWYTYQEIIGLFLGNLKYIAEQNLGAEITNVVLGRPVHYNDINPQRDAEAQNAMEHLAKAQGFKEVLFQYEPLAAAKHYEQSVIQEELACIVDVGAGTSDFTIIKLHNQQKQNNRVEDILANHGVHIGGTDFDKALNINFIMPLLGMDSLLETTSTVINVPKAIYYDLSTWHLLHRIYEPSNIRLIKQTLLTAKNKQLIARLYKVLENRLGHYLLDISENSKKSLSNISTVISKLNQIEPELAVAINRADLETACHNLIASIKSTLLATLKLANLPANSINTVFLTGGTTQIPAIQKMIRQVFANAKLIYGDIFGSVGKGLALEAHEIFGC